jgi:uncharacterized protein (TIGR03083 family)
MPDDPHLEPYLATVSRVNELARSAPASLDLPVVACPGWSAREVVAHLAGLAEDWVAGGLDDYGSDAWAGAQVARFAGRPMDEVLVAWAAATDRFVGLGPSPIGGTPAMWAFGDAVVHEADLRPVLAPGTRVPDDAVALGLKAGVARWRGRLAEAGATPLDIVVPGLRTWRVGEQEGSAPTVTVDGYELFRAVFGRRSRSQVEAWGWSVDPTPYLDAGLPFPFRWASVDVDD